MIPSPRTSRGFTLVELVIAVGIAAILTAGAMALLGQQQRAFQNSSAERALQETARAALTEMAVSLRRAGYGIDPYLAFDFGPLNVNVVTPNIVTESYQCPTPVLCRDRTDGPDEIVFYARDPAFGRLLSATPTTAGLSIQGGLQTPLYQGQVLQVMCSGGSEWAYVTVGAFVAVNWTPPAAPPASTAIALSGASPSDAFPRQNGRLAGPCYQTGFADARVFKVDRFRYYVARFAEQGVAAPGRPYLMLDRGLFDASGNALVEPVAPDVEDLQLAYVFPNTPGGTVTMGATLGTRLASSAASIDLASVPVRFDDDTDAASRQNQTPSNIRAVRVSIVTRTPGSDIATRSLAAANAGQQSAIDMHGVGNFLPGAGNRGDALGDPFHHRLRVDTTQATRNLDARAPFYPTYSTSGGSDGLNVGGG